MASRAPQAGELKKAHDEIRALKAELAQITAAPTKPSRGLQDALTATQAAQVVPRATSLLAEVQDCPRVELKGRRVVVIVHGPVGHDFIVKLVGMVGDGALDITMGGEEPRMAYDRCTLRSTSSTATPRSLPCAMASGSPTTR